MTADQPNNLSRHKVLLAADAGSYSMSTVNLAVAMAASTNTLLQGLFIEDEDLLQVTGLPCTREITLATATERPLNLERLQQSLRQVAVQFEQNLKREAQALQVSWRCETVRGRVRDIGSMPRAKATYTIFARPVSSRLQSARTAATLKILVLGNGSPYRQQALDMLLNRPGPENVELTFCGSDNLADSSRSARGRRGRIRLIELEYSQLLECLAASGTAFDYAIVSRHENGAGLWALLDLLRCPVILVD